MTRKQRRLILIGVAGVVLAVAVGLVLYALSDRIVFFNAPSDIIARAPEPGQRIRLGGLVETGSVVKSADGRVNFAVTDGNASIKVSYRGILPDLFREGQGVVAEGALTPEGVFAADVVLAKHDERYLPPDVAAALKKQGVWREGEAPEKKP
jgi:cytochrome c-type biogenesis protein CcmE